MRVVFIGRNRIRLGTGIAAFIGLILLIALASWDNTASTTSSGHAEKLLPIYRVATAKKVLAISFDACWGAEKTENILSILKEEGVKTTFFLVNIWLKDYPEKARLIAEEGHEIGLHSTTHPHFSQLSTEGVVQELRQNHAMIVETTGYTPVLFRPPFGEYDNRLISTTDSLGYQTIQWDVDSLDWKGLSAGEIYQRVITRIKPGSIVLFHNDGQNTAEVLPKLLQELKRQGYRIVPVSELLIKGRYVIDNQGEQKPAT